MHKALFLVAAALASTLVPARAEALSTFSGTCQIGLKGTFSGNALTLSTEPSLVSACATSGLLATATFDANLEGLSGATCVGAVDTNGTGALAVSIDGEPFSHYTRLVVIATVAAGKIDLAFHQLSPPPGEYSVVGTGGFVPSAETVENCLTVTEAHFTGTITFSDPEV